MKTILAASAIALAFLTAPALAQSAGSAAQPIPATLQAAGTFTTLLAAAEAAGLSQTLAGPGPLTLFAPTDEAFAALPAGTVDTLLKPENKAKLVGILSYHVVPGAVLSSDLTNGQTTATVQGSNVTFDLTGAPKVDNATIVQPDLRASNGVIHVIDTVLMPPN